MTGCHRLPPIEEHFSSSVLRDSLAYYINRTHNAEEEEVESLVDCGKRLLKYYDDEPLQILIEIVGATGLIHPSNSANLKNNKGSSRTNLLLNAKENSDKSNIITSGTEEKLVNAYVALHCQNKVIHSTKTIKQDNNPIWSVSTGSICLLEIQNIAEWLDPSKLDNKLTVLVCHETTGIKGDKVVGRFSLDPHTVLSSCNEQRIEYDLQDAPTVGSAAGWTLSSRQSCRRASYIKSNYSSSILNSTAADDDELQFGSIALRFRIATSYDLSFLRQLYNSMPTDLKLPNEQVLTTEKDEHAAFGEGMLNAVKTTFKQGMAIGRKKALDGSSKYIVKPGPDPSRPQEETEWLSKDELVEECAKPSTNWVITGTGNNGSLLGPTAAVGKVYLEILSCQNLPNMDLGEAVGNLTDCFVAIVYEDTFVDTTVINDELSPMWMPWTTRAFVLHMKHPLSTLYIGAFDYDIGHLNNHEGIGRVAVNLQAFSPGTSYTLDYNLYSSSNVTERNSFGTITIRLRMELEDERAYLLAGILQPPPRFHVNVTKEKSLAVVRYVVNGAYDDEKFDLMVLRSYVGEMFEYQALVNYAIGDSITSLILWRPQWHIGVFQIPLHSIVAFVSGAFLVETPRLLPSFFCFGVAWIMIASMSARAHNPSPWLRCRNFLNYLEILIRGRSSACLSNINVEPGEGAAATARLEAAWKVRRQADAERSEKLWELQLKLNDIGKEEIHAGTKIKQIDPLAAYLPILIRVQKRLRGICDSIRRICSVLKWEDSLLSFKITLICLLAGIVLLVLPWELMFYWVCRISVWTFLGPWMKLVDIYIVKNDSMLTLDEDERQKVQAKSLRKVMAQFNKQTKLARLRGEEALKNAAARSLRFGNYSAPIPERNITRHFDYPLSNSMASPNEDLLNSPSLRQLQRANILRGHKLEGAMIPCHVADRDTLEYATPLFVQEKLKALQAVAFHLAQTTRPSLRGHRTSKPVSEESLEEKLIARHAALNRSPTSELKKSSWNRKEETPPAGVSQKPWSMVGGLSDSTSSSSTTQRSGATGTRTSPTRSGPNNSRREERDAKNVHSERESSMKLKGTEEDGKDETEEQGMEVCLAITGCGDLALDVGSNCTEETKSGNPMCSNNSFESWASSPIRSPNALCAHNSFESWTSTQAYRCNDYVDVMFIRKAADDCVNNFAK